MNLLFVLLISAPGWCKGEGSEKTSVDVKDALQADDPRDAITGLVGSLCHPDDEATQQAAALEESRQKWSKRLFMADDDWQDAAEWSVQMQSTRNSPTFSLGNGNKAWSQLTPSEQFLLIANDIGQNFDANYMTDAFGNKLSEAGRLAFIRWCMGSNNHEAQWAVCQPDIDAFDQKKLGDELHADKKRSGAERMAIRIEADLLKAKLKEHAKSVAEAKERDPAYAKMFELAVSARKQFEAFAAKEQALLDLALTMDDARITNSKKAFDGCDNKTWPALKAAIADIPAKKFAHVHEEPGTAYFETAIAVVANDPAGYLAAGAHYVCKQKPEPDALVRIIGEVFGHWPGYRGPRNAGITTIMTAGLELDQRDAKPEYPEVNRGWFDRNSGSNGGGGGIVAKVQPQGQKVRVEFAKKLVKELHCVSYKTTNRIQQIRSDGTLVYESICLKTQMKSVDYSSMPQNVSTRYSQGLKGGMYAGIIEDVVAVAWPKAGAKAPSIVAGVAVK